MSSENEIQSLDPANEGSLAGTLMTAFRKLLQSVDGMLPAEVVSYDRQSNVATVKPLIQVMATSGQGTSRAKLAKVPVLALGGGGFVINFPLRAGDKGWIEASDRDISLYTQGGGEAKPGSLRMHSFSDGRFIPDVMSKFTVTGEDDGAMVIQSYEGGTKIVVREDSIDFVADKLNLKGNESISIQAPVITQDGAMTSTGSANFEGETTIQGRSWLGHGHKNVQPGSGNSGGVV